MMMEKVFCKGCGRRLKNAFFGGERIIEFEEGFYCEKCAKERSEKKRKEI